MFSNENKREWKVIGKIYNECKSKIEKDQQTLNSFDYLFRKSLQDKLFDIKEYESLLKVFTTYKDGIENDCFSRKNQEKC